MVYLVLLHLEGVAFGTDKDPSTPRDTYGETYEPSQKAEAYAYFWNSLEFAVTNRKRLNEAGAGDYTLLLCELDNEESEEARREIYRVKITPSGAVGLWTETETQERELIKGIEKRLNSRFLITDEPILEGQAAEVKRLLRTIPKA